MELKTYNSFIAQQRMFSNMNNLPPDPLIEFFFKECQQIEEIASLIQALGNQHIKEYHWREIFEALKKEYAHGFSL